MTNKTKEEVSAIIGSLYELQWKTRKSEDGRSIGYFSLSKDEFKKIAGRDRLDPSFTKDVDSYLKKEGYTIIDLSQNKNQELLAFIKIKTIEKIFRRIDESVLDEFIDEEEENRTKRLRIDAVQRRFLRAKHFAPRVSSQMLAKYRQHHLTN